MLSGQRLNLPGLLACGIAAVSLSGCSAIMSSVSGGMADGLADAILNQEDPALVREALPSYLLLLDSFVQSDPDNAATLSAAAQLYAAYGGALVDDPERAKILTTRARNYGERALCASNRKACELDGISFDQYQAIIESTKRGDIESLYSYSLSSLAFIRANADDYGALADLPKIEFSLEHLISLDPGAYEASASMYLGILKTLRPPALGGEPEVGKAWFERGIALSEGKDLSIKVEYARGYARPLYERELHDQLLNEVLAADVEQEGLTLFNILAQEQARALLDSADDYF